MNFLSDFDSEFFYEFISYFLSSQLILVIYSLFIHLKTLNTIGRHVPNVLVFEAFTLSLSYPKSSEAIASENSTLLYSGFLQCSEMMNVKRTQWQR